jgi:hypothetical protein
MKKSSKYSEEIGWYGMVAVLVGYFLVSLGFVAQNNLIYVLLNFTGSIGLGIISYKKKAVSLYVFYFLWAIFSLF